MSMIVKAKGPSGPASIRADDTKRALSLVSYLRTIGYEARIEDSSGRQIEETELKKAVKSPECPSVLAFQDRPAGTLPTKRLKQRK